MTGPMAGDFARLRDENETLREEVRQLRDLLVPPHNAPPEHLRLTPAQARLFMHLKTGRIASLEILGTVLAEPQATEPVSVNHVHVQLSQLRKRIAPHGYTIVNRWGQGWTMTVPADATGGAE